MLYRANILLAETDDEARELLATQRKGPAPFPMRAGVRDALLKLDSRNVAGEARAPNVGGVLPTSFYGGPDTVVEQIKRCREEVGVGVLDLAFQNPGAADTGRLMHSLELLPKRYCHASGLSESKRRAAVKVSFFETAHYRSPRRLPAEWPVPPDAYDHETGARSYRGMIERIQVVEELGFDWVSVAEHHYSPHRLTPAPIVSAAHLAAYSQKIKIAVLGPIVSQSNRCKSPRTWQCSTI